MVIKFLFSKDFKKFRNFLDIFMNFLKNFFIKDIIKVINVDVIKQVVKNLVLIVFGERFFNFDFGFRVIDLLFELMDLFLVDVIRIEIEIVIKNFEFRIFFSEVVVILDYDINFILVFIEYEIIGLLVIE